MADVLKPTNNPRTLTHGTRILVISLILFGASAIGYGGYALRQAIVVPFRTASLSQEDILNQIVPKTQQEQDAAMKLKDTDGDSLNDYDETYTYSTNPYLTDSDSDGIADNIEVKNGTDPNCAKGQDCRSVRLVTPDTKISDLFPEFSDSEISLKDKTLQEFKKILLDNGFSKETLDATDDQTLLVLLEEILKFQDEQSKATSTPTTNPVIPEDPDKVRQFLIDLGVPANEVYSLSNQEILAILKTLK